MKQQQIKIQLLYIQKYAARHSKPKSLKIPLTNPYSGNFL
jgi:hypothetical protein